MSEIKLCLFEQIPQEVINNHVVLFSSYIYRLLQVHHATGM